MKVFISRLFLTIAGGIQDFLLRLLPCSSKFYYKGLYGHISDFELFFLDLIFTPKLNFLDCIH